MESTFYSKEAEHQNDINLLKPLNENEDEALIISAQSGDTTSLEILVNKYKNLVKNRARAYFLIGSDKEDIIQEGMIGLFKAIRDYKDDKQATFKSFAEICITRQIITAIKTATRQKHIPLNSYISLNKPVYDDDDDKTLIDYMPKDSILDPEEIMIDKEVYSNIELKMQTALTELEKEVLKEYLIGDSYQTIAKRLDKQVKSIDNALQRIKKKVEKCVNEVKQIS